MGSPAEKDLTHRPWPLPSGPWVMFQSWRHLLFAHWEVPEERLRAVVPAQLQLDGFGGRYWLGIASFLLTGLRARWLPGVPTASTFPELNVRTYVRHRGRAGIYFFSLDAASLLAVLGARLTYGLPYFHARAELRESAGWLAYGSERVSGEASFQARYRGVGEATEPTPGSLEHFLTERYALFVIRGGRVSRGEIHHPRWRLRPAEAHIERNTMADAAGIEVGPQTPLLHLADRQDTIFWPLVRAT